MLKSLSYERIQKGLSLIEASMVLVLSAVVVAGVMVYYQTAQTNHQLEQTAKQIMHIVSEINGLYAGARDKGNGIYHNISSETVANAVADLEPLDDGHGQVYLKTALPKIFMDIGGVHYDPVTKTIDDQGSHNAFSILLAGEESKVMAKLCQKIVALNFGSQALAFQFTDKAQGVFDVDASAPFSDRLKACQGLTGTHEDVVAIAFK